MALHRKRKDDEKMCYFCKEQMTNRTIHGGYFEGRGRRCCDNCYPDIQKEENHLIGINRNQEMSLGEEQAYKRFGI